MGFASSQQLQKLLSSALPKLFKDVKEVIVKEEELDIHTYYIHVFVGMDDKDTFVSPNEPNVNELAQIQKKIRELSYYLLLHVNQITFYRVEN